MLIHSQSDAWQSKKKNRKIIRSHSSSFILPQRKKKKRKPKPIACATKCLTYIYIYIYLYVYIRSQKRFLFVCKCVFLIFIFLHSFHFGSSQTAPSSTFSASFDLSKENDALKSILFDNMRKIFIESKRTQNQKMK